MSPENKELAQNGEAEETDWESGVEQGKGGGVDQPHRVVKRSIPSHFGTVARVFISITIPFSLRVLPTVYAAR